ncbi:MAG TPA: glycosyltransferase family 2 protein, partial [Fimbriiglobus sp.]|nr:glycosyltransferase family 2 protein [Fimbriiglobus sp.]
MAVAAPPPTNAPSTAPRLRTRPPRGGTAIETPQLSVVIVNFCQWKNTARLTRQLRRCEAVRRGAAEIVIVDNHSPANRAAKRLCRLSGVSVVRNGENRGFARAVNRGGRLSRGEWVLLLNPDVTVPDGFLDDVLDAAQRWPARDPKAGVVGFQLRNRDGTKQASSGPFPTLVGTVAGLMLPRSRRKTRHRPRAERRPVPWATGGCLLVRRDCYEEVGGLDENFFLYYEDVDFCRRARRAGWSVWYEPDLRVTHHFPLHARAVPPPLRLVTRHALLTYSRKHWPRWQ